MAGFGPTDDRGSCNARAVTCHFFLSDRLSKRFDSSAHFGFPRRVVGFFEVEFEGFPIRGFGGPVSRSNLSGVEILTFASANIVRRFLVFNLGRVSLNWDDIRHWRIGRYRITRTSFRSFRRPTSFDVVCVSTWEGLFAGVFEGLLYTLAVDSRRRDR